MKISCDRELICECVGGVSKAVSAKSNIPSIEGILFKAKGDTVEMTGYDLEIAIISCMKADISEEGEVVLNARLLFDMIHRMTSDIIYIETDANLLTTIKSGITEFSMGGIPASDFPELPKEDYRDALSIPCGTLKSIIEKTIFAVSQNDQKPVHQGSLFEIEQGAITMVSVDGFRLALCKGKGAKGSDKRFIVPAKALGEIAKLIVDDEGDVDITTARRNAVFRFGDYTVMSRLLEGDFLDYRRAIPGGATTTVIAPVKEFIESIDRVSPVITDRLKNPVKLKFLGDVVTVNCATQLGRVYDEFTADMEGDDVEIGFNHRYLLDALKNSGCERVKLEINGPLSPMKMTPLDGEEFLFLVLPVRIKNEG